MVRRKFPFMVIIPGGGGALPLAGIRHAPVNRPPFFCIACTPNAPFLHNFTPMTPIFADSIKKFQRYHQILENFANRSENFFKNC